MHWHCTVVSWPCRVAQPSWTHERIPLRRRGKNGCWDAPNWPSDPENNRSRQLISHAFQLDSTFFFNLCLAFNAGLRVFLYRFYLFMLRFAGANLFYSV